MEQDKPVLKDLKNHTPGPWYAFDDQVFVRECDLIADMRGWGWLHRKYQNDELAYAEQLANAKLIAKAPEMYEALKQAKEALEYSLRGLDPHDLNTKGMIREALETINKLGL